MREGASHVTVRVYLFCCFVISHWRLMVPLPLNVIALVLFVAISSTQFDILSSLCTDVCNVSKSAIIKIFRRA